MFLFSLLMLLLGSELQPASNANNLNKSVTIYLKPDTNAAPIALQYRFQFIPGDAQKSVVLEQQQKLFLRQHGLPTGGFARLEDTRMKELDRRYWAMIKKLAKHPYRDLYRQIGSQVLLLYYCTSSTAYEASFGSPSNKLIVYLNEFKATQGINLGLIYTCFSKFRDHNSPQEVCKHLKEFLPYCERLLAEEKAELGDNSEPALVETNESDKSVLALMKYTLQRDEGYLTQLKRIARDTHCAH